MDSRRLIIANGVTVDLSEYLLKSEAETLYATLDGLSNKQDKLISGTNIKTINGTSILGSGNITIEGGSDYLPLDGGMINGDLVVLGQIASPMLIQATGGVQGYLRSGGNIIGLQGEDIIWGTELDYNHITAKGNGTKFLSDDGTYKTISGGGNSDANVAAVDTGDVLDDVNVSYATTAYVDGLIGDINSVLESIING